jgi:CheY-like chemotaxis protein
MGGQIAVESEPGRGSTFWFTVPFKSFMGTPSARSHHRDADLRGRRVLVVDDNATNRIVLEEQLSSWELRVDTASDAVQGLRLLRQALAAGRPYELAVLDMQMPGMDGLALARAIKADVGLRSIHLLLLTSLDQQDVEGDCAAAGIEALLTKPVRQSQLFDVVVRTMAPGNGPARTDPNAPPAPLAGFSAGAAVQVLVAEDSPMNQRVALGMLEQLGYGAVVVNNGREALDALERVAFAAVLMDCQMPEMDGFEATMEIRRRESAGQRIPIIAMTANAMKGDRERCLAAGMDDYISKPVRIEDLKAALRLRIMQSPSQGTLSAASREPALEDRPVLDLAALTVLRATLGSSVTDSLGEFVAEFRASAQQQLSALRAAVEADAPAPLASAAHRLKGDSALIGAIQVRALCAELEALGREPSPQWNPDAESLLTHLERECNLALLALESV